MLMDPADAGAQAAGLAWPLVSLAVLGAAAAGWVAREVVRRARRSKPAGDQGGPLTNGANHHGTILLGDVDLSDSRALSVAARQLIDGDASTIYVDLGRVTSMSTILVGFLVQVGNAEDRARRHLVLCRPTPIARKVPQVCKHGGGVTRQPRSGVRPRCLTCLVRASGLGRG
jgi:anti-anti-sigma regulatory factor